MLRLPSLILLFVLAELLVVGAGQAAGPSQGIDRAAIVSARAVRRHPARVVIQGDSIADGICPFVPSATCMAFPGAFVSDRDGFNHVERFIDGAGISPGDVVVMSSIGGFHAAGVDDAEIVRRVRAAVAHVQLLGGQVVWLTAPEAGMPACGPSPTPQALANFGSDAAGPCMTMALVRAAAAALPVDHLEIIGPYVTDQIHQTDGAKMIMAMEILSISGGAP